MRVAGAYERHLEAVGPRGTMALDAYELRVVWKYGGYPGAFPGVRQATRRLAPDMVVHVIAVLIVAAWVLLVPQAAKVRIPVPAYEVPRPQLPDLASARMTTGPPAVVAAPEAPVISP